MGKKGGSSTQTTTVELPPEIKEAALANLGIADSVASLGATPYNAPSIAGFSPQQMAAMRGTDQAASAFGMPSAVNWREQSDGSMRPPRGMDNDELFRALTGMRSPNSVAGGFRGYNTAPIGQAAFAALPPAQRALIQSFVMNPRTGAAPKNSTVPVPGYDVRAAVQGKPVVRNRAVTGKTAEQRRRDAEAEARWLLDRQMYGSSN